MAPALPIKFQELLQLGSLGVNQTAITFNTCVRSSRPSFNAL
jgi:clathrin heavy chain